MAALARSALAATGLVLLAAAGAGQANAGVAVTPAAAASSGQTADPAWEAQIAALLLAARREKPVPGPSVAQRLSGLGEAAAPALLDACSSGRVVLAADRPAEDLALLEAERGAVGAAAALLGREVLLRLAAELGAPTNAVARRRALLGLELAGQAEDLELAVGVARSARQDGLEQTEVQRELERTVAAIAQRDERCDEHLHRLLEQADDWIATSVVRGMACAQRPDVLLALAIELDHSPRLEPLILSALPRAASNLPTPYDLRVLEPVRERLSSTDTLVQRAAAAVAAYLEDFEALPALIGLLDSGDAGLRATALEALRHTSRRTYGPQPQAWTAWLERERQWYDRRVPVLGEDLVRADVGRALAALRELSAHRYRRHDLARLAVQALDHQDARVRSAACAALARLGSGASIAALCARLDDGEIEVARAAQAGLAVLHGLVSPPVLDGQAEPN